MPMDYPYIMRPNAQPAAAPLQFPGAGNYLPPPQTAPQAMPQVMPQPPVPPQGGAAPEQGLLGDISKDPSKLLALLQFAGQVMQPVTPGQTQSGVIGNALSSAVNTFAGSRKSEQGVEAEKATLLESKRKDVETNPTETSKIKLDEALMKYYERMGAAKGTEGGREPKPWEQPALIKQWKDVHGGTDSEAAIGLYKYQESQGTSDPLTAALKLQTQAGANVAFSPEAITQQAEQVRGTPTTNIDQAALQEFNTWSDEQVLSAAKNPQAEAFLAGKIGQANFDRRWREAQAKTK